MGDDGQIFLPRKLHLGSKVHPKEEELLGTDGKLYIAKEKGRAKQVAIKVLLKKIDTQKNQKEFYVVAAHLKSGESDEDLPDKMMQAEFMSKELNGLDKPFIVGCDFNTNTSTDAFKKFKKNTFKCCKNPVKSRSRRSNKCITCKNVFREGLKSAYPITQHIDLAKIIKDNPHLLKQTAAWELLKGDQAKKYEKGDIIPHELLAKLIEAGLVPENYTVTSEKRRPGGKQPEKCKDVDQTIDFIFHSDHWTTHDTLTIPSLKEVLQNSKDIRMPNWQYPSDHFMIGAELDLK